MGLGRQRKGTSGGRDSLGKVQRKVFIWLPPPMGVGGPECTKVTGRVLGIGKGHSWISI